MAENNPGGSGANQQPAISEEQKAEYEDLQARLDAGETLTPEETQQLADLKALIEGDADGTDPNAPATDVTDPNANGPTNLAADQGMDELLSKLQDSGIELSPEQLIEMQGMSDPQKMQFMVQHAGGEADINFETLLGALGKLKAFELAHHQGPGGPGFFGGPPIDPSTGELMSDEQIIEMANRESGMEFGSIEEAKAYFDSQHVDHGPLPPGVYVEDGKFFDAQGNEIDPKDMVGEIAHDMDITPEQAEKMMEAMKHGMPDIPPDHLGQVELAMQMMGMSQAEAEQFVNEQNEHGMHHGYDPHFDTGFDFGQDFHHDFMGPEGHFPQFGPMGHGPDGMDFHHMSEADFAQFGEFVHAGFDHLGLHFSQDQIKQYIDFQQDFFDEHFKPGEDGRDYDDDHHDDEFIVPPGFEINENGDVLNQEGEIVGNINDGPNYPDGVEPGIPDGFTINGEGRLFYQNLEIPGFDNVNVNNDGEIFNQGINIGIINHDNGDVYLYDDFGELQLVEELNVIDLGQQALNQNENNEGEGGNEGEGEGNNGADLVIADENTETLDVTDTGEGGVLEGRDGNNPFVVSGGEHGPETLVLTGMAGMFAAVMITDFGISVLIGPGQEVNAENATIQLDLGGIEYLTFQGALDNTVTVDLAATTPNENIYVVAAAEDATTLQATYSLGDQDALTDAFVGGGYLIGNHDESLQITANRWDQVLTGDGDDVITGTDVEDNIVLSDGADTVDLGADDVPGGRSDVVEYSSQDGTAEGLGTSDTIYNFAAGDQIKIHLSLLSPSSDGSLDLSGWLSQHTTSIEGNEYALNDEDNVFLTMAEDASAFSDGTPNNIYATSQAGMDSDGVFLYDGETGNLFFDASGAGSDGAIKIATIYSTENGGADTPAEVEPADIVIVDDTQGGG